MQNIRDEIVPVKLERITSHHKHPPIIEQQKAATHQQPKHQQLHKTPTPHITKHNTLKVGCETMSRNLDLTMPMDELANAHFLTLFLLIF